MRARNDERVRNRRGDAHHVTRVRDDAVLPDEVAADAFARRTIGAAPETVAQLDRTLTGSGCSRLTAVDVSHVTCRRRKIMRTVARDTVAPNQQ